MSDVKILRSLYESKQHDVTTRWRDNKHYAKKKFLFNNKMLGGIIKNYDEICANMGNSMFNNNELFCENLKKIVDSMF